MLRWNLAKKTHPSRPRPGHMRNAFPSTVPGRPPLCTPKTSAQPPPTCPVCTRDWPSCSPRRACPGVGLPVGTRDLPRLGGAALLPRGSRWSAEVSKHEKSPSSGPMCHGKGRKANKGHNFWTIVRTYYSKRSSSTLWTHGMPRSINLLNLLTVFARIAGPLSQNNPGATTEVATARTTGHHLKHAWTLHFRGKNCRSKKILCSKQVCFWENLSTTAGHTNRDDFWNSKKTRKLPKTTRFQDLRVFAFFCGLLHFCAVFLRGFAGFLPSRLMRCKHFLAFVSPSPKSCNQSPKIEDQSII